MHARLEMDDRSPDEAAYQGAPGAFSEDAAIALAGPGARLRPCRTLEHVFAAVEAGDAATGVVPIENTLAGPVPGCADLLARADVHIVAERIDRIVHALVAPAGVALADVRRVLSHPVAIAQCEGFFRTHPQIVPVPAFDTAGAVADLLRGGARDAAAIASARAAAVYGGVVLAHAVQDREDNFTRFLRIARGACPVAFAPGRKTTLVCRLANRPGSLLRALEPFASRGLNLTRIESRPIRDCPFEYLFHLDVAPADAPAALAAALEDLSGRAVAVRVIGHYPA
jgi:prephenate dehydratase